MFSGFLLGLSLILAIGAQNAFVLRQGIAGHHVFWLCLFCSLSDAILISIGVLGFSTLVAFSPNLTQFMVLGGAAFLVIYGTSRFRSAYLGDYSMVDSDAKPRLSKTIAYAAVFTWANPHVYLDTVALIGAVSTGYPTPDRWFFGLGAVMSSFFFFFSLGYGARHLAPLLSSPGAWRVLDVAIGVLMWWLAVALVTGM
ncbi:MAG: amino acid transporter [Rhodobacteraceae bacterium]|nr:amino acid transporter [Paracoccaceae bacterium]